MAMHHQPDPDWTWMGDRFDGQLKDSIWDEYYDDDPDEDDCND